jgi:hypothetical protein
MNLSHFCDPTLNYFPNDVSNDDKHLGCNGQTIIEYGTEIELTVRCNCSCHHWGWTDITTKWRPGQIEK